MFVSGHFKGGFCLGLFFVFECFNFFVAKKLVSQKGTLFCLKFGMRI